MRSVCVGILKGSAGATPWGAERRLARALPARIRLPGPAHLQTLAHFSADFFWKSARSSWDQMRGTESPTACDLNLRFRAWQGRTGQRRWAQPPAHLRSPDPPPHPIMGGTCPGPAHLGLLLFLRCRHLVRKHGPRYCHCHKGREAVGQSPAGVGTGLWAIPPPPTPRNAWGLSMEQGSGQPSGLLTCMSPVALLLWTKMQVVIRELT